MNVLGVVVARGGSKGIPKKNLLPLLGKSLLAWTADCAKAAKRLDRIILSTDDEEIADAGRKCGLEVPFMRPKGLASDTAPTVEVIRHALRECQGFDAVFTLQPTNPLRIPEDIDGAVELLEKSECYDAVIGYSEVGERHPARMVTLDAQNGRPTNVLRDFPAFARRQELPRVYLRNGAVYVTRVQAVEEGRIEGRKHLAYVIPPERAWNVDELMDLAVCSVLMDFEPHEWTTEFQDSIARGRQQAIGRKDEIT